MNPIAGRGVLGSSHPENGRRQILGNGVSEEPCLGVAAKFGDRDLEGTVWEG